MLIWFFLWSQRSTPETDCRIVNSFNVLWAAADRPITSLQKLYIRMVTALAELQSQWLDQCIGMLRVSYGSFEAIQVANS